MEVYLYQAALYCEACGEEIIRSLAGTDKEPEEREEEETFDSDDYPKGPYPDGGGEADSPQHCDTCGMWLENPLTGDGVRAVQESIVEFLAHGRGNADVLKVWAEGYADGIDWAEIGEQAFKARI